MGGVHRTRKRGIMRRRQVGTRGLDIQAEGLCHSSNSSIFSLLKRSCLDLPVIFLFQVFLKEVCITHYFCSFHFSFFNFMRLKVEATGK